MPNLIKITLAILLFSCLFQFSYSYYVLVRYLALAGFAILAYQEFLKTHERIALVFVILAFLFQPIFKIPLGREVWMIVDVLVGVGLFISIFFKPEFSKNS